MKTKNICCIGAGFVGGPTMAVIALKCPEITINVVDINQDKIDAWNGDLSNLPVFEPGLADIISKVRNQNLFFSTNIDQSIDVAEMIFMAVNTPTKTSGKGRGYAADLTFVENCAKNIARVSKSDKIIIEKSTLPVRTAEKIKEILDSNNDLNINFDVLSNPEFLAEGTAINDLFKSDRVLIGGDNTKSGNIAVSNLVEIYSRWIPKDKILTTNVWSSELSKLVSNAMLAQRISSINSISALCEKTGAKVDEVSIAVGMDKRIGPSFLNSSIGFGGSCFKKDILNLVYISKHYGLDEVAEYWENVVRINDYQTNRFGEKIIEALNSDLNSKTISILGWAFKKDTNDSRESASISLAKKLLLNGAKLKIYDPMVSVYQIVYDIKNKISEDGLGEQEIDNLISNVTVCENFHSAIKNSNLVSLCTDWDEFKEINWKEAKSIMSLNPTLFDGRNLVDKHQLESLGYQVYIIGKP
ncbi:nucleotide sugar dehydrogenase [bacterium]|nr:nucleotide sugar dehydrogenase [bacterium]